ncbi:MAG: hypothetical protein RLZZ297_1303 [Chloroflexota bacterium]|jgi:hypothetical protein
MNTQFAAVLRTLRVPEWYINPKDGDERNMARGMYDGLGVGVVEGVQIFIPVLFTRLGADPLAVGLLSSLPALAGLLLAVPIGMLIARSRSVIPWYAWSRLFLFLSYPLMALMPLFFERDTAILAMLAIAALSTIPQASLTLVFNVVMGSIIDVGRRYFLMSLRWSILGVSNGIAVYLAGLYLAKNTGNDAYATVIGIASLFIALAFFPARRYEVPAERREQVVPPKSIGSAFALIVQNFRAYPAFRLFVLCQAVFQLGMTMAQPLFPLHWVRVLHADDASIGLVSMVQSVTLLFGYTLGAYFATRYNARVAILWVCLLGLGAYPLITALAPAMEPLVYFAAVWGVCTAGIELVILDVLLDSCPPGYITTVMPSERMVMFGVRLVGPLAGTAIARWTDTTTALIVAAALHFIGAGLFIHYRIGTKKAAELYQSPA